MTPDLKTPEEAKTTRTGAKIKRMREALRALDVWFARERLPGSVTEVAEVSFLSRQTVQRALDELCAEGIIQKFGRNYAGAQCYGRPENWKSR